MSSATIDQLRDEHVREVIGAQLLDLLRRIVRATASTYPPGVYGGGAHWDGEALADLLHDWVEARLLRRGELEAFIASCVTVSALRRALTTSLSQYLVDRRHRTSASNLFTRTRRLLESDPAFARVGAERTAARQLWTVAARPAHGPSERSVSELTRLAWQLSNDDLEVVRYGPSSLKSSPILRQPALHQFLTHLLGQADGALSLGDIAAVMRARFSLHEIQMVELTDLLSSTGLVDFAHVETADIARSVLTRLGPETVDVFRALQRTQGDLAAAAQALGRSQATVVKHLRLALSVIAELATSSEEAAAIYAQIAESLFQED
jgi:hypothetical protein